MILFHYHSSLQFINSFLFSQHQHFFHQFFFPNINWVKLVFVDKSYPKGYYKDTLVFHYNQKFQY